MESSTTAMPMKCIICNAEGTSEELTQPKSKESWQNLVKAAEIQKLQAILEYKDVEKAPDVICYHLNCRKKVTHKKTLEKYEEAESSTSSENMGASYSKRRRESGIFTPSTSSRILQKVCIFCDRVSKYKKGSKTREPLRKSVELRSDATVRQIAEQKMDTKILAITSRELVAAEAHYHISCYRGYTRSEQCCQDQSETDQEQTMYSKNEKQAYDQLFEFMRNDMFSMQQVISMKCILERLIEIMASLDVTDIKRQTKNHVRRKVEAEFGNSIEVITDEKGRLYVVPDSLSKAKLVQDKLKAEAELESLKNSSNFAEVLKSCATEIRNDVNSLKVKQVRPPNPEKLDSDYMKIPESLKTFLRILISGRSVSSSVRVERLVQSISEDCVFAISRSTQKPAKQILLPWTVKTLTGNVEIIKILNRLGHGISYDQLEEIDTALCLQKLASEDETDIPLPAKIVPCIPTNLAFDNIDRLEETLSGSGTSHRVNGIIVQPNVPTVAFDQSRNTQSTYVACKSRSINPPELMLTPYISGERVGPPAMEPVDIDYSGVICEANTKNLAWIILRQANAQEQKISSWTGFNIQTRDDIEVTQDTIGYLPTINAPASDMTTVHEILQQSLKICKKLDLNELTCVFDQAIYAKAMEVKWKQVDVFRSLIIRLGAFHTICTMLAIIGKRFQDAGLRDLAVESEVVADGSIGGVLDGRKYNRSVRLHKLVYETLLRLAWKGFLPWLEEHHLSDLPLLEDTLTEIENIGESIKHENFQAFMDHYSCRRILQLFSNYLDVLRYEQGELSAFWMSYVDMVEIVLGLIRASREGNWILHMAMIKEMIPWCFAYDRLNYARYLPVYYTDMTRLETDYPDTYNHFTNGGFSVQLGQSNTFGRLPVDQTIEETANKDTQTAGGTKGFSLKPGAVSRYYLTAEYRSTCLRKIRDMVQIQSGAISHVDLEPSRIQKDEKGIQSLTDMLLSNWINPFERDRELISLSTGSVAPNDVKNDLFKAKERGEAEYSTFKKTRLTGAVPSKAFYERMPKLQLKTFTSIQKSKKTKVSNKEIILKADHRIFGHMVLIAANRNLDMRQVLQHPLGPLPWALANCDGTMKKTNKAALARHLENRVAAVTGTIAGRTACIIDGMSLVHKVNGDNRTFAEVAECIFMVALQSAAQSKRIDIVFDVYNDMSIKSGERDKRSSESGVLFHKVARGQKILQWKRILASSENKTSLITFLSNEWQGKLYLEKLGDRHMYVTCMDQCYRLTLTTATVCNELSSSQEEADTRLLLHAKHASEDHDAVIIVSEDTDVFILCLAFHDDIGKIFIRCGTKNRIRYIDVTKVGFSLGQNICRALIGLHAFTGCDSVSAFSGRGKVRSFKQMMKDDSMQEAMINLGESWNISSELFLRIQEYTCKMYAARSSVKEVNDLRYQLFRAKRGDIESQQLPPCEDTLYLHTKRANYQAAIWRNSLQPYPNIPDPVQHGWSVEDGCLVIDWMEGLPAPEVVLDLIACKCSRQCKLPDCQCLANGLKCSPACRFQFCDNMIEEEEITGNESSDSDSDCTEDLEEN